jgi:hypothetical protein
LEYRLQFGERSLAAVLQWGCSLPQYHRHVLFVTLALAAGSAACSSSNPAGPTSSGAAITGSLVSERALAGATVTVASTGARTTVDGSSRFAMSAVPPGTVRLMFKGPSLDGSIQLTGVKASDTIDVKVRVNGSTVSLESEHRNGDGDDDDDDENEAEIEGTLTALTGASPTLTLIVGGRTVTTTAATVVRMSGTTRTPGALAIGQRLEVEGILQANGSIVARKIQIEDDEEDDDEDEVEFTGTLTARAGVVPILTLTVGGRTVLTNASTEIRTRHGGDRLDFSALVVGATLEVKGDRRPDATIVARRIRVGS